MSYSNVTVSKIDGTIVLHDGTAQEVRPGYLEVTGTLAPGQSFVVGVQYKITGTPGLKTIGICADATAPKYGFKIG